MKDYIKVEYRDIAKMLAGASGDSDYRGQIESYLETIKAMPKEQKLALKTAYMFSRKAPRAERQDLFQELALELLKARIGDERLAYSVARCDWINWWRKFSIRQHYSLDSVVEDEDGNQLPYAELLVGDCEFENRVNGRLDAEKLYNQLPEWVQQIVDKRLLGKSITGGERHLLDKWIVQRPTVLANYVK